MKRRGSPAPTDEQVAAFAKSLRRQGSQRVFDRATERGIGVDHAAELLGRHRGVDREREHAEYFATVRPDRCGANENATVRVLDELDETFVAEVLRKLV